MEPLGLLCQWKSWISSRVKDIRLFHSQAENSGFSFIRSAKAAGDPSLGAVFHLFSILTGRFQSQKPLGPAVNSVPQVSPPSLRSSPPRNIFWGIKTTWWSSTAQNVIQPFPKCDPALSMGIWGGNARWVVCQHRQHSRCDVKAKTDLWKPAWSKTGWKSWFIPSHQRGAAALCCTHSGAQHMVGKALSVCPGLEQPPKVLPSVIPCGLHNHLFNRALGHCLVMSWNVLQSPAFWTNVLFFSSS